MKISPLSRLQSPVSKRDAVLTEKPEPLNKRTRYSQDPSAIISVGQSARGYAPTYNSQKLYYKSADIIKEFRVRISSHHNIKAACILKEAAEYLDILDPIGFATVISKIGKRLSKGDSLDQDSLNALLNKAIPKANAFSARALVNTLCGIAKIAKSNNYPIDQRFIDELQGKAWGKLAEFTPQGLSNTLWSFAELSRLPNGAYVNKKRFLDNLLNELSNLMALKHCEPIDFSMSIYSLATLSQTVQYENKAFIGSWLEFISRVTNRAYISENNQASFQIAINYLVYFATPPPLELECKLNDKTLLTIDESNVIGTKSLTSLGIDIHHRSKINHTRGCYIPYMSPMSVKFTQEYASGSFRCDFNGGPTLNELLKGDAKRADWRINIPPIRVVRIKEQISGALGIREGIYSLDNRRLCLYKELYKQGIVDTVPVVLVSAADEGVLEEWREKIEPSGNKDSIIIRGYGYKNFSLDELDWKRMQNDEAVVDKITTHWDSYSRRHW